MECNQDFRFEVSISKDVYKSKEETSAATASGDEGRTKRAAIGLDSKICFKEQEVNVEQLLERVLEGHTFCYLFGGFPPNTDEKTYVRRDGYFTMSGKADCFFKGSYVVGVDIDDTAYDSAEDFVSKLSIQPTFWYTTLSHKQIDKNKDGILDTRFRAMFVFDRIIEDKYFFRYVSSVIHNMIETDTQEKISDPCGKSCSQYFNGTNYDDSNLTVDFGISNIIYSLSDFQISDSGYLDFLNQNCEYKESSLTPEIKMDIQIRKCKLLSNVDRYNTTHTTTQRNPSELDKTLQSRMAISDADFDKRMIVSFKNNSFDDFRKKNRYFHHFVYRAEREDGWEYFKDIKYQRCDENYLELPWISTPIPIGEHRPTIMLSRAVLRRIMEPSMTPTDLLYNLILDREWNFINTDNKLSLDRMKQIVKNCFAYSVEELKVMYKPMIDDVREKYFKKKKFIIHWTCKGKIKANTLAKELRWEFLDSIYDRTKSVDENLQIFKDSDLDTELEIGLSRSTLYTYCESRDIHARESKREARKQKFFALHKEGMSLREEAAYLAEKGLKASPPTISKWIEELKKEKLKQTA